MRVFVVDGELSETNVTETSMSISQSDLVHFLVEEAKKKRGSAINELWRCNIMKANELFDESNLSKTAIELRTPITTDVLTSTYKINTLAAFRQLFTNSLSAIALVDERKRLVGTLSASDLRGMNKESMSLFDGPLIHYMHYIKSPHHYSRNKNGMCSKTTQVQSAIKMVCGWGDLDVEE